jgi:hypothetical protein
MANVLKDTEVNLYVYIYPNDHKPAHVHVFVGPKRSKSSNSIKINIGKDDEQPEVVLVNPTVKTSDIKRAVELVMRNREMLLKKWRETHGKQKLGNRNKRDRTG